MFGDTLIEALIAQRQERWSCKPEVVSSTLTGGKKINVFAINPRLECMNAFVRRKKKHINFFHFVEKEDEKSSLFDFSRLEIDSGGSFNVWLE